MSDLEQRLSLVASRLTIQDPFVAAIFCKLPRRVMDGAGAAATNGKEYRFYREFCDPLDNEELFGLAYHETLHVVFMHMWRRERRDHRKWNYVRSGERRGGEEWGSRGAPGH